MSLSGHIWYCLWFSCVLASNCIEPFELVDFDYVFHYGVSQMRSRDSDADRTYICNLELHQN